MPVIFLPLLRSSDLLPSVCMGVTLDRGGPPTVTHPLIVKFFVVRQQDQTNALFLLGWVVRLYDGCFICRLSNSRVRSLDVRLSLGVISLPLSEIPALPPVSFSSRFNHDLSCCRRPPALMPTLFWAGCIPPCHKCIGSRDHDRRSAMTPTRLVPNLDALGEH